MCSVQFVNNCLRLNQTTGYGVLYRGGGGGGRLWSALSGGRLWSPLSGGGGQAMECSFKGGGGVSEILTFWTFTPGSCPFLSTCHFCFSVLLQNITLVTAKYYTILWNVFISLSSRHLEIPAPHPSSSASYRLTILLPPPPPPPAPLLLLGIITQYFFKGTLMNPSSN